jgi:putative FmdB family regulatory protein
LPLYEYRCKKCGDLIEKIQKFSDPPLSKHAGCGGKLELVLSSPAIQFKGSGFYITDYARKSSGSEGASSGSAESSTNSSDSRPKASESSSNSASSDSTKAPKSSKKKDSG